MCMYVCMYYVWMCVCIYVCVFMYVCVYMYVCVCVYVCMCVCMSLCMCMYVCIYLCIDVCMSVRTCICTACYAFVRLFRTIMVLSCVSLFHKSGDGKTKISFVAQGAVQPVISLHALILYSSLSKVVKLFSPFKLCCLVFSFSVASV